MQFVITPAAGKRLIAKAIVQHPAVQSALKDGTVVVLAGTTNGYVAEELLQAIGQADGFSRRGFVRGMTMPPSTNATDAGGAASTAVFAGDVVIAKGVRVNGKTIFDIVDDLQEGDVVLKGANAIDLGRRQAAVLIGHPKGGTIGAALQAVVGRRVRLILPAGLEKRVHKDLHELAALLNAPGGQGARLLPVPGDVVTEIEALALVANVRAELVAAGGVCGAEGAVWLAVSGSPGDLEKASALIASIVHEPAFGVTA